MMKGWQIFTHSLRQVFGNLEAAIRVSGILYLVQFGVAWLLGVTGGQDMQTAIQSGRVSGLAIFATLLVSIVTGLWIAVAWHRYILTEEGPGILPAFHGDRMLGYFGKGILITLIMIIPALVLGFLAALITKPLMLNGNFAMVVIVYAILVVLPLVAIALRLSAMLPGAALKPGVPVGSGWAATGGEWGTFIVLGLISAAMSVIANLVMFVLLDTPALSFVWQFVFSWIVTMVGVSILTTLYGHYIEGRELT
jgi:hypothetical protein